MLSEVLGELLYSTAFAELVVDEHGELALVPLSPLWGLSDFIKNNGFLRQSWKSESKTK